MEGAVGTLPVVEDLPYPRATLAHKTPKTQRGPTIARNVALSSALWERDANGLTTVDMCSHEHTHTPKRVWLVFLTLHPLPRHLSPSLLLDAHWGFNLPVQVPCTQSSRRFWPRWLCRRSSRGLPAKRRQGHLGVPLCSQRLVQVKLF